MEVIKLVLSLLTAVFIGWNVLYAISSRRPSIHFFEKLFISYGLGFGCLSLEMFILFLFNIKFGPVEIIGPWALLFIFNTMLYAKNKGKIKYHAPYIKDTDKNPLNLFLAAGIIFEAAYAFFRALIKPIEAYDAMAIYAIKSKIFYLARSIPHDYLYNIGLAFPHPDYPLNIPLSETFVYLFLGNINEQLVKAIFPLYFIATLGILYFAVRRLGSRTYALMFTFILATIPQFNNFATNAYTDLPLSYYYLAGILFLLYWFRKRAAVGFLYLSAVMTALAGWTKNEGLVYCAINVILLTAFLLSNRAKIRANGIMHGLGYAAVIIMMLFPWLSVRNAAQLVNSDYGVLGTGQFNVIRQSYKIWPILYEIQRQIFGPKKWNILWMMILAAMVIYRKKIFKKDQRYLTISLLLLVCSYAAAHMFAQKEIVFLLKTVWSRQMIHFTPIAVYWLAVLLKDEVKF